MAGTFRTAVNNAIPWLLFSSVLMPALGSAVVGILILVFWREAGDIALGVLTIMMGAAVIAGTFISLGLLWRQNRMAAAQADFIAHVSHELRTPMASILMGIETLRNNRFENEDERRAFLKMLDIESKRLSALVEQVIGYQVASGHGKRVEKLDTENHLPESAVKLVSSALSGFLTDPKTKDSVVIESPQKNDSMSRPGDLVSVDFQNFAGAMCNLVNNSLTHGHASAKNPVRIRITSSDLSETLKETATDSGEVVIEVTDRGPGMTQSQIKNIFKKFQRGADATEQGIPGLGLGLSIVCEFTKSAGGKISVDSEPGKGTSFRMVLPRVS